MRDAETLLEVAHELVDSAQAGDPQAPTQHQLEDGGAPTKRAGRGEDFWQFKPYQLGDSVRQIDWKRTARAQSVFIKQREETTAPTIGFWCDGNAGFDWSSGPDNAGIAKAEYAIICQLAVAIALSKAGFQRRFFSDAPELRRCRNFEELAERLCAPAARPTALQALDFAIIASDFYDPISMWQADLTAALNPGCAVILLRVVDPVEADFPFMGRVEFTDPRTQNTRQLGRAERLKGDYIAAFNAQAQALTGLARAQGYRLLSVRNNDPMQTVFSQIMTEVMTQIDPEAAGAQTGFIGTEQTYGE